MSPALIIGKANLILEYNKMDVEIKRYRNCPVEIGDRFYRKIPNMTIPDRLVVKDIKPADNGYLITGEYMYHFMGKKERVFSSTIFNDPSWVIEKKDIDFYGS